MPSKFLALFLPFWSLGFTQRVTLPWLQAQLALQLSKHTPKQSGLQQRHRAALPSPHHLTDELRWMTEAALGHAAPWEVLPQGVPLCRMSKGVNSSSSLQRQPLPNEFQPHILRRHSMCLPGLGSPLHHSNNPVIGHEILSTVSHPSLSAEKFY